MKRKAKKRKSRLTYFQELFSQIKNEDPSSSNRNNNACTNDQDSQQPQLYPHIRKIYNSDTCLLEYARIIMSTVKPDDETIVQQRRARVSKQRAKVLISEYCTRKLPENLKISTNKRNHSSSLR